MSESKPVLTLNDKQYPLDELSEEAKNLVQKIQLAQGKVKEKQLEALLFEDAYNAAVDALTAMLEADK